MPPPSEDPPETRQVLRDLIAAFEEPGDVHVGLASRVVIAARELLDAADPVVDLPQRTRMPTRAYPRSAVVDEPDGPPVPPAAL